MVHGVTNNKNYHWPAVLFAAVIVLLMFMTKLCQAQTCVQNCYTTEIGVREATGNNDGEAVEKYLASTNLGPGYAWCASFVNWCFKQCGYDVPKAGAWSPAWFPSHRLIINNRQPIPGQRTPLPGDVFGLYFPSKQRIAHVGFIDEWGQRVTTVEGNTNEAGSREGDGVYKKYRLASQIFAVSNWINL